MAKESFSVRWHVAHSNVRTSIPRSPGETRANPILCLQTGHIGRSIMEEAPSITQHPPITICICADFGLFGNRLWEKILAPVPERLWNRGGFSRLLQLSE
jgi:hypothetical protein